MTRPLRGDLYLAGLFDAEGSICMPIQEGHSAPPRLQIVSNHRASIVRFSARYGGRPFQWARTWRCHLYNGHDVRAALQRMLPCLVVKQQQALLALGVAVLTSGHRLTPRGRGRANRTTVGPIAP